MSGKQEEDPQEGSTTALASFFQTLLRANEEHKNSTLKKITLIDDNARSPHESLRPWNTSTTTPEEEARPCFHKALSTGTISDHQEDRWNTNAISPINLKVTRHTTKLPIATMRRPPFSHSDSPNSVISIQQKQQQKQKQQQQQQRQTGIPSRPPPPFPPMQRSSGRRQLNFDGQRTAPIPPSRKHSVMEGNADHQPFSMRHESDSALVCPKRTSTATWKTPFSRVSFGKNNSKADTTSPKLSKPT